MCFGLPCRGVKVTLVREFRAKTGQIVPRNSVGEVVEEYLGARQVDVHFFQTDLTVRLPESAVSAMPSPEPEREGGPVSA